MFKSLFNLANDLATIVSAPVEMVVDLVAIPVKEVANVAKELVADVKSIGD